VDIKRFDYIRVPKGAEIRTTHSTRGPRYVNAKNRTVCVDHVRSGKGFINTVVVWVGQGGYWFECDLNLVTKVEAPE